MSAGFAIILFKGVQYWTETSPASDYIQYDGNSLWDWPGNALAGHLAQKRAEIAEKSGGFVVDHRKAVIVVTDKEKETQLIISQAGLRQGTI